MTGVDVSGMVVPNCVCKEGYWHESGCFYTGPKGKQYEEIKVNDEEIKYKKLCESQERLIASLEAHVDRLELEILYLKGNPASTPVFTPETNTSTTIPTGVILKSKFRENIEDLLREKAIQKQEENK
jgi:hypothetical protein